MTDMKITITSKLLEKYPTARFIAVLAKNLENKKDVPKIEKLKRELEKEFRKNIESASDVKGIKEEEDLFFKKFGKDNPLKFQLKSILEGKDFPNESALKDILFMVELKHSVVMSGQDIKNLGEELVFDINDKADKFTMISGKEVTLKPEDIVLRKNKEILISHLYGPGKDAKVTIDTDSCLFLLWHVAPVTDKEIDDAVHDLKEHLKIISTKSSTIEVFEVMEESGSKDFVVTPWDVKGNIDYDKLVRQFGTKKLDDKILERFRKITGKDHPYLRRKIFYSHMYFDDILNDVEKGKKIYLYTGRAPSGPVHMGHLFVWMFTKWLQDVFDAKLLFQIVDEEKFLAKENLTLEDTKKWAYENALDIIALGFDPKKTHIFLDTEYAGHLYPHAIKVAKKITFSTIKSTFGFGNDKNIGIIFYTAMQSTPVIIPSVMEGKNTRVLIPCAIDQDVHFRLTRDVVDSLGYYKPATILSRFLPGLHGMQEEGKMSSSIESTAIFTTDDPKTVRSKIMKYAFSGGRDTVEEHRRLGGNPEIDVSYQWLTFFEEDDAKLEKIYKDYKSGKLLSGELKQILVDKINDFLGEHQKKREWARKNIEKFMLRD